MELSIIMTAASWGLLSASSLLIGAVIGYFVKLSKKTIASLMGYGSGVLIAALCFSQIPEAHELGGTTIVLIGLLVGGITFLLASQLIDSIQKKKQNHLGADHPNVAMLLALGALLDGVPESLSLGLGFLEGGNLSIVLLVAIFLSNLPEGLGSAASMREEGKSAKKVLILWGTIVVLCALSAALAPALLANASPLTLAFISAFSAGAVLCMLVDSMIPEAFETTHAWTGIIVLLGFMTAFALQQYS